MKLQNDSISVVILGDWNKLFIQPEWVAENVFKTPEMEIGIEGAGAAHGVIYKKDEILMKPTQSKVQFSVVDVREETIQNLAKYINNYLEKAYSPSILAYGFNVDYADAEDARLAEVFDGIPDTDKIADLGYEIQTTEIKRSLEKDGKTINMQCKMTHSHSIIHFNEHHPNPAKEQLEITADIIEHFFEETKKIIEGLGYRIEDETDE